MQGMKQTILRSTDIIIMCEWSTILINSNETEERKKNKRDILEWLVENNFKFFEEQRRGGCDNPSNFNELSL